MKDCLLLIASILFVVVIVSLCALSRDGVTNRPRKYLISLDTYTRYKAYETMLIGFDEDIPRADRYERIERELNELVEYGSIESIWVAKLENELLDRYHYIEDKDQKWQYLSEKLEDAFNIQKENPFSCDIALLVGIVLSTKFYNELAEPDCDYLHQKYCKMRGGLPSEDAISIFKKARRNKPHTFLSIWAVDIAAFPSYLFVIQDLHSAGLHQKARIYYTEAKDYLMMLHSKYDKLGHKTELNTRQQRLEKLWQELYPEDEK